MASDNDVVINASMDGADAAQGVSDLLGRFQAFGSSIGEINSIIQDLDLAEAFTTGLHPLEMLGTALEVGVGLIRETATALDDMIAAYDKASDVVTKFYDQKEKAAKSGKSKDSISDSGMPEDVEAALREMGAIQAGYAPQGTWTRRFQNIGSGLAVLGGDFNSTESDDHLASGKKQAADQREMDDWNDREKARRAFAVKAEEQRYRQEQSEYDKWAKEQHDIDEKEQKARERAEAKEGAAQLTLAGELSKAEEAAAKRRENFDNQQKRRGMRDDGWERPEAEQTFRASIVSLDSIYNSLAAAGGGSKVDPVAERKRIQAEEKAHRDELQQKQQAFEKELFDERERKEEVRMNEMRKGLGLA